MPVRLLVSDELPVSIAPNETADVTGAVLSAKQLDETASEAADARLQTFFALQSVLFANGYDWSITPNPNARTGSDAIGQPRLVYPRALIDRDASRQPVAGGPCVDDRGRQSSPGLVVAILNEPGRVMRCADGRWLDATVSR